MKRLFIAVMALVFFAGQASAADNYTATQGTGKTFRCLDLTSVCFPYFIPSDNVGHNIAGAFGAAVPLGGALTGLSDATNLQPWMTGNALGDGISGNNIGAVAGWMWNGTTWDRLSGTAAKGQYIQSKAAAFASGSFSSGAFSSGAFASGAFASGAFASSSMVDLLTFQGSKNNGTAAANSLLAGTVYNSSPLTLTNGQQASLQGDANGYLKVNVAAGGAGGGAVYGPTAAGSAAANPPVLLGGTIDGTATGAVKNAEIVASGSAGLTDLGVVVQDPQLLAAAGKGVATNGATYPSQSIGIGGQDGSSNIQPFAMTNWGTAPTGKPVPGVNADVLAVPSTEQHLGEVAGNQIRVDVAQTVTASSAYTSGNAVGGLMTVANAARVSGSLGAAGTGGILQQVAVNSKSAQTAQMDIFIFNANPTSSTCTDKSAFVLATADFDKVVGVASVPSTAAGNSGWFSGGTGSVGQVANLSMLYDLSSATSLYACMVTRGTPTFTATTDISLKYEFLRN